MKKRIKKALKWRIVCTALFAFVCYIVNNIYQASRGTVEGSIAVKQLEDSDSTYILSRSMADGLPMNIIFISFICIMFIMWSSFLYRLCKEKS
jgi:hypothetical protein